MQILPTSAASTGITDSTSQSRGRDEFGFSRLVSDIMTDAPAEITPSLDATLDHASSSLVDSNPQSSPHAFTDSNANSGQTHDPRNDKPVGEDDPFVADAPYLQSPTHLNPEHVPQDVRFTASEMEQVADALKKAGVDREIVDQMLKLAGNPMGVTAQDMIKSMLQVVRKPVQLSDTDLGNIRSFAQRLDPSGSLSEGLLADVRGGRTNQAWQRILDALHSADSKTALSVNRDELLALGKGLGVSDATLQALRKAMGHNSQARMTPAMLEAMMTPVQHELGERKQQLDKLASAIDKALGPVAQQARLRLADEQAASSRSVRSADQSQVLIEDTVTRKGMTRTQPGTGDAILEGALTAQRQHAISGAPDSGEHKASSDGKKGTDPESFSTRKGKSTWGVLNERLRVDSGSQSTSALYSQAGLTSSATVTTPTATAMQPGQLPGTYAPQVFRQVEQGVFSAMKNGANRLELQLAPAELGTVTVVLTMKNGEISAMLRPERSETTTLLNQQADQLRFALEQQGLKVDKVEVQTQTQDQRQSLNWQGMDQHNMTRDQQARSEEQERMLRLGRIGRMNRRDQGPELLPGELLDRNMQSTRGTAGVAGSLHIVT